MQKILIGIALAMGGLITYVDSRPSWDDTGVTAMALLAISGIFGFIRPKQPWIFALALGVWIPIFGFFRLQNLWTLLALALAFVGAYSGAALRKRYLPIQK